MKPTVIRHALFAGFMFFMQAGAGLPPDLPGEEISEDYLNAAVARDTAEKNVQNKTNGSSTGLLWLDKAQKTWDAPPFSEQMSMAADETNIPIGKGGIFVPRFTAAISEPDVTVLDSSGGIAASGNTGRIFSVEPGPYKVSIGSGASNQRMIRPVIVEEGKKVPVIPEWAGLAVETVDSTAVPFRGEYELVRIDNFETYGRGFGANPELGEMLKTWILKPGVYKILGVGQGYNSITNFVTVKLSPGELCKFLLVQDTTTFRILGGGTVEVTPQSKITSYWKYGANVGGNIKFNSEIIRTAKETRTSTLFGLLSTLWLSYHRNPYEWRTRVRLDEGFNFSGLNISNLLTDADDFILNSLFIWRYLSWLGPYGIAEIRTTFLPRRYIRDEKNPFFCRLDADSSITDPSTSFDTSRALRLIPSFSPMLITIGIGVNADALRYSFLETNIRAGVGSSYSHFPSQLQIVDTSSIPQWATMGVSLRDSVRGSVILLPKDATADFSFGPQFSLSGMLRIARYITADGELKILMPVAPEQRLMRPDFDLMTNISWRLSNWITLDYTYTFLLKQPENTGARLDKSTHGVWLRFSFSSR